LAFVQLDCVACGSAALGLLMDSPAAGGEQILDVAGDPVPAGGSSRGATRAISQADVDAIRDDLAAWDGDLIGWLDALEDSGRSGSAVDR